MILGWIWTRQYKETCHPNVAPIIPTVYKGTKPCFLAQVLVRAVSQEFFMDAGRELQLTLMYREKVTFAVSFPSVRASIFHLLLCCRKSFA